MELRLSHCLTADAVLCDAYNALRGGQMTVPQLQNVLNLKLLVYSNLGGSFSVQAFTGTTECPRRCCSFSQLRLWAHDPRRTCFSLLWHLETVVTVLAAAL